MAAKFIYKIKKSFIRSVDGRKGFYIKKLLPYNIIKEKQDADKMLKETRQDALGTHLEWELEGVMSKMLN